MQKLTLVLTCLACSAYGRRVQVQPSMEQSNSLQTDNMGADFQQQTAAAQETTTPTRTTGKSLIQTWFLASGAPDSEQAGWSFMPEKLYCSLYMTGCACICIFILCLIKRFEFSLYSPKAGQTKGVAAYLLCPDAKASPKPICKKNTKEEFVSSETDDTGDSNSAGSSDRADTSDTDSTTNAEECVSETDDIGNVSDLGDSSDVSSSVTLEELAPVALETCSISPTLLSQDIAGMLLEYLPAGLRVPGVGTWRLCYKPSAHGTSMKTLHRMIAGCESSLLLIKDADGHTFGGFAPSPWKVGGRFHGSGEAFVFSVKDTGAGAMEGGSDDINNDEATLDTPEVQVFPWTASNRYVMYAENGLLAMGGGDGSHAIAVYEGLLCGHSSPTPTFDNPSLTAAPDGDFVVKDMELWSLEYPGSSLTWC